mmetsp:Transcript_79321/g.137527  ORF Transcript_79321/g.137527 Transcript_79321/m.137527 type:complete len:317 (+) Transcript_79321:70-1020(+)
MPAAYCAAFTLLLLVAPQVQASSMKEMARAFAGLRGSAVRNEDAVAANSQPSTESIAQTLKALDTDGDGKVGKQEIEQFARDQGLSTEEVRADFADLDRNNDGELEASEIGSVMTESPAAESEMKAPQAAAKPAPKPMAVHASKKASPAPEIVDLSAVTPVAQAVLPEQGRSVITQAAEEQPRDELNLESLQQNAERQAGSVLAETLARQAQQMFQQGEQDEQRAQSFEKLAKQLRGNITALARSASAETKRAASLATTQVGNGAITEIRALQRKSKEIEHEADQRRKSAKEAMQRVLAAQGHLAQSTRLLSAGIQ